MTRSAAPAVHVSLPSRNVSARAWCCPARGHVLSLFLSLTVAAPTW